MKITMQKPSLSQAQPAAKKSGLFNKAVKGFTTAGLSFFIVLLAGQSAFAAKLIKYHIVVKTADTTEAGSNASSYVKFHGFDVDNNEAQWSEEVDLGSPSRNGTQTYTLEMKDLGVPTKVRLDLSKGLWLGNNWKVEYVRIYRNTDKAQDNGGGYAEFSINEWRADAPKSYTPTAMESPAIEILPTGEFKDNSIKVISVLTSDNESRAERLVNKLTQLWTQINRVEISNRDVDNVGAYAEVGYTSSSASGGLNGKVGITYEKTLETLKSEIQEKTTQQTVNHSFKAEANAFTFAKTTYEVPYRNEVYETGEGTNRRIIRTMQTQVTPGNTEYLAIPRRDEDGETIIAKSEIEIRQEFMAHMTPGQRQIIERKLPGWIKNGWVISATADLPKSGLVTDGVYYWLLNGDGSRNWVASGLTCKGEAVKVPRVSIDLIPKRHGGKDEKGYMLDANTVAGICSSPGESPAQILTNGSYFWLINSDGSRNWLGNNISQTCRAKAQRTDDIGQYPKRFGGVDAKGYALTGEQVTRACSI